MAKVITTEELKKKIDSGEKIHLVDVLSEQSFEARHIPTSVNIPGGPDFAKRFETAIGEQKNDEIIVYCSSATCPASPAAADALEEAGYTNVVHYKDGIAGWQQSGNQFEGTQN